MLFIEDEQGFCSRRELSTFNLYQCGFTVWNFVIVLVTASTLFFKVEQFSLSPKTGLTQLDFMWCSLQIRKALLIRETTINTTIKLSTWNLGPYHSYTVKWTYGTSEGIGGFMVLVRIRLILSMGETWCIGDILWLPLSVLTKKQNKKWKQ